MAKYIIICAAALFYLAAALPIHHMDRRQDEGSQESYLGEFQANFNSSDFSGEDSPNKISSEYYVCHLTALLKLTHELVSISLFLLLFCVHSLILKMSIIPT